MLLQGGQGLTSPPLFLPSVFVVWKSTSSRPPPTTVHRTTRLGTISEIFSDPGVPGCTPVVQVCLDVLSLGTYPPFWPLASTCSRPLLGLEG